MPLFGSSKPTTSDTADQPQNDPVASASAAAGTEWLAGHLHHLTDEQQGKLEEFKKLCAEKGYYKAAGEDGGKASHDDATVLYVFYPPLTWYWVLGVWKRAVLMGQGGFSAHASLM